MSAIGDILVVKICAEMFLNFAGSTHTVESPFVYSIREKKLIEEITHPRNLG